MQMNTWGNNDIFKQSTCIHECFGEGLETYFVNSKVTIILLQKKIDKFLPGGQSQGQSQVQKVMTIYFVKLGCILPNLHKLSIHVLFPSCDNDFFNTVL